MKKVLTKVAKIISTAIFILLLIIIGLMVYYLISVKIMADENKIGDAKINFYTILTQSMYPEIKAGDIIITYKDSLNIYAKDDIITFVSKAPISSGLIITHRITDVSVYNGKYSYVTKGDNNATEDTTLVSSDSVIGRVVFRIPKAGYIQQFISTKYGWLIAVFLPALGIIIYDFIKLFKKLIHKSNKIKNTPDVISAKKELEDVINSEDDEML